MSTQTKSVPFTIIPNREVFLSLPEESQQKVELIYKIAVMGHNEGMKPMEWEDFVSFYDRSIPEIQLWIDGLQELIDLRAERLKQLAQLEEMFGIKRGGNRSA